MGTLMHLCLLVLIAGGLKPASSRFISPYVTVTVEDETSACSSECIEGITNSDVKFIENRKYKYFFNGKTTIVAPTDGQEDGISEVSINGKANIIGTKNCGAILYLKNVEITQGSKTYGNTNLEGEPILFSYNNGKVGPKICSSDQDTAASLNLKRAIASAFQLSTTQQAENDFVETDIQGTCKTSYTITRSDKYSTVTKSKNLAQCTGYNKISLYGLPSEQMNPIYQDSPFSSAVQRSDAIVIESTIKSAKIAETFEYRPLGPMDLVTKVMVSMDLDLKKWSNVPIPELNLNKGRSIVFETTPPMGGLVDVDSLVAANQLAVNNLEPVVEMYGAKHFSDLTSLLKMAKKDVILSAYQQIKSNSDDQELAETLYINALVTANNGESIEAAVELIRSKQLSDSLANSWLANLANANCPTKEAVVSASSLLNQRDLKKGYLGVGTLLQKYLKDTQDYESDEVKNTLYNLGAPLRKIFDNGPLSSDDEDFTIASIKGIGNVQYIDNDTEDLLVKVIMDKTVKQRIRAAALAMVSVYAKNSKIEKACESIFVDSAEDSELRILAFKTFATNPSVYKASVINNVLSDKNCQLQIRAYLTSYLNNLKTTGDESKFDQMKLYNSIDTTSSKRMLNDLLRYSQSLEYNTQCPLINSASTTNVDVIYSYNSYLARYSSVSLKASIFGRNHDVFDFDVRVENIEPMLENLFGPDGYFSKNNDYIADVKNYVNQAINYAKSRGLNNVDSELTSENDIQNTSKMDMKKMYIDVALKVFGNDLGWFAYQGIESQVTYQQIIDAIYENFNSAVPDHKDVEVIVKKQIPFIDYERKYATSSGLPVTLKVQGTSAIKIDVATKFDLNKLLAHPENTNFALKFIPSGSVTLDSSITINGHLVDVGHKLSSSLHTSTGSEITMETVPGSGFKIIYDLPLDVMDVLSVNSGVFTTVQEEGSPLSEKPLINTGIESQTYARSFEDLGDSTGLSFYVQYGFPCNGELQSIQPFSGPMSMSLKIIKVDKNLSKYIVEGTYDLHSPTRKYVKFVFVTPESDVNRGTELFAAYDTNNENKMLMVEFVSPSGKIIVGGKFIDTVDGRAVEFQYTNGPEHVLKVGYEREALDDDTVKYSPVFETAYAAGPNGPVTKHPLVPILDVEGYAVVKRDTGPESAYPSALTLRGVAVVTPEGKHSLQGSMTLENDVLAGNAKLTTGKVSLDLDGTVGGNYPDYRLTGTVNMTNGQPSTVSDDSVDYNTYAPASRAVNALTAIRSLNLRVNQELRVESPYKFVSNNRLVWDDDHLEMNGNFLIDERDEFSMYGNVSTSDLLDLVLNANITVLPRTDDSGLYVLGLLQHSFIHDPSNSGHGDIKFVQGKDKRSGYFEFNSECPKIVGVFHINSTFESTDESYTYDFHYDLHDGTVLNVNMNQLPDNITLHMNFDSPNHPDCKSHVNVRGWSTEDNKYSFDTNLLWPGSPDSNYLNANGEVLLDEYNSHASGNIDFPLANLPNVHVSVESNPIVNGGVATVRCVSNEQLILSEKFNYKITQNNGDLYLTGVSVPEDSEHLIPIQFTVKYNNFLDKENNIGKELAYRIALDHNDKKLVYQRCLQFTNRVVIYRQLHKINEDEQKILMDLEHKFIDLWHWSYMLKSKVISPSAFNYLIKDYQNLLEFNSYVKVNKYSLDEGHSLKIYSSEGLDDSYEFRWFIDDKKSAFKVIYGQREIRGLGEYSLKSIDGGYAIAYAGQLWLDYSSDTETDTETGNDTDTETSIDTNAESKSTLSGRSYYSLKDGLSTATDIKVLVPTFNGKEMSMSKNVQIFKSWENPLNVKLYLDIFPTVEKALEFSTNWNRSAIDNGVVYSADIAAKSEARQLDYLVRESIFVSNEKWGKYLDVHFVDTDNIMRPLQLHFELVSGGFTNKINIFDVTVVDVNSTFSFKEDLNTKSVITYNGNPYTFELSMTDFPTFNYSMEWNDNYGNSDKLMIDGYLIMDDKAKVHASHIRNNGEVIPMGSITKYLNEENWWGTKNEMNTNKWNLVWGSNAVFSTYKDFNRFYRLYKVSLEGQFVNRFIDANNNIQSILSIAKKQRNLRIHDIRRMQPQYRDLIDYSQNAWDVIYTEVSEDDYLTNMQYLMLNTTEAVLVDAIDLIEFNKDDLTDMYRSLRENIDYYSTQLFDYYSQQIELFLVKMFCGYEKLLEQIERTLNDLFIILNQYTDKPVNDMSTGPHSLTEYFDDMINTFIEMANDIKNKVNAIQVMSEDYIRSLPINVMLQDQIEMLKTYPYKEKLYKELHDYLHELERSAPTREFASFINALDKYLDNVIHDRPITQRDEINLRTKGLIVAKSFVIDFSNYVDYNRAMYTYNAIRKLANVGQTMLYMASPSSYKYPNADQNMLNEFSEYIKYYKKYLNPSNLLPPFKAQGVIINSVNVITYNDRSYSFMPGTGCYTLAKDYANNKFSVLGNYDDNVLTSISVLDYKGQTYALQSGGSITVDGEPADFPLINENVKTWKDVYFFGLDTASGVSVKCSLKLDIVEVFVNGFYYGQVQGLLGAMFQEPTLDFKMPDGKLAENMESFLLAYRNTGDTQPAVTKSVKIDQLPCPDIFSEMSIMKECHSTIPVNAYTETCNQMVSVASEENGVENACLVAKAYVSMARKNFAPSSCTIPQMCTTTTVNERTLTTSTNVEISTPSEVADVIILFEESSDDLQPFTEVLKPFMEKMTKHFNHKRIRDVNFIVIGYSGNPAESDVHIHTANKNTNYEGLKNSVPEWSTTTTTKETTTTVVDSNGIHTQVVQSVKNVLGENSKNKAYKLSADYPFRANAVKIVLSVADTLYVQNVGGVSTITFDYITSSYMKQGIKFYLIAPIHLNDPSDPDIFGASGVTTIYTMASPKGKTSDDGYNYDQSLETSLTTKTDGAMFDADSFLSGSAHQRNIFLRSACKKIVDAAVKDSVVVRRTCTSEVHDGVMPYPKCIVVA